jgi:hypothetical protein
MGTDPWEGGAAEAGSPRVSLREFTLYSSVFCDPEQLLGPERETNPEGGYGLVNADTRWVTNPPQPSDRTRHG